MHHRTHQCHIARTGSPEPEAAAVSVLKVRLADGTKTGAKAGVQLALGQKARRRGSTGRADGRRKLIVAERHNNN